MVTTAAVLTCVLLAALGIFQVLLAAGALGPGLSDGTVRVLCWVVVGYFALGIAMNLASRSRPERAVMTPLCMALTALTALVAIG